MSRAVSTATIERPGTRASAWPPRTGSERRSGVDDFTLQMIRSRGRLPSGRAGRLAGDTPGAVCAPAAVGRDLARPRDGVCLADEALHTAPVGERDGPDRKRPRHARDEPSEGLGAELPDLHLDAVARRGTAADEPRLGRFAGRQLEEPVGRRRAGRLDEACAERDELAVEGFAAE